MKDAWTQTTPKSKEQLDKERREYRQRKQLLLQQQQLAQMKQQMDQQQKPSGLGQHYSNQLASGKIANLMNNNQTAGNN